MRKSQVFIGSSSEGLELAYRLQSVLESTSTNSVQATVWTDGVFRPSEASLVSLTNSVIKYDYSIFIFLADDVAVMRGQSHAITRDNVIFESGLFIGKHGKDNFFILKPRDESLHLPTDLLGITWVDYDAQRVKIDGDAALREPSIKIVDHIRSTTSARLKSKEKDVLFILEIAARLVADRAKLNHNQIRAFCHLFDPTDKQLKPFVCFTGDRQHDDRTLSVPCSGDPAHQQVEDWFIISKAFRNGRYYCEDIDWPQAATLPNRGPVNVWSDLKAVAAYPLRRIGELDNNLGTIAVDSAKKIDVCKWANYENLEYTLRIISDHISNLLL